jgi:hypothetical protein
MEDVKNLHPKGGDDIGELGQEFLVVEDQGVVVQIGKTEEKGGQIQ